MTSPATCTETGCAAVVPDVPDQRCGGSVGGGPTGAGCGALFCDAHLWVTEQDGFLCAEDLNSAEAR